MRSAEAREAVLEMTEALVSAHKAATRADDAKALALLEPLLLHAGRCLASEYRPLPFCATPQVRNALDASLQISDAVPPLN